LGWSLHSLSRRHLALDRAGDALAPAQEAVAIFQEEAKTNPLHQADWASALHTLSRVRSGLNQTREALALAREAVAIWRPLVKTQPLHRARLATEQIFRDLAKGKKELRREHTNALVQVGTVRRELGQGPQSPAPDQEAVALGGRWQPPTLCIKETWGAAWPTWNI
jgi:hypothetical protein